MQYVRSHFFFKFGVLRREKNVMKREKKPDGRVKKERKVESKLLFGALFTANKKLEKTNQTFSPTFSVQNSKLRGSN